MGARQLRLRARCVRWCILMERCGLQPFTRWLMRTFRFLPSFSSRSRMLLVLDFDETYTADPQLWDSFIWMAKERGHEVVCCTYRPGGSRYENFNEDVITAMQKHDIDIVFAADYAHKKEAMEKAGYILTSGAIWIDDWPELITGVSV